MPETSSVDRTRQLDTVLSSLTSMGGVTAAGVIDNDGFMVHIRRDAEIDTNALGAGVHVVFGAATKAALQSDLGTSSLVLVETQRGLIMLLPLEGDYVLAVLADQTAMLGAVRFEAKMCVPELNKLI